jgi:hypothetical protein
VDDLLFVEGRQRLENRRRDAHRLGHRDLALMTFPQLLQRFALEQLHHQEGLAVVGHVIVENGHPSRVVHLVGDVALAQEAAADGVFARELGVQDLQRHPRAVAMGGGIDRRHPSDAQQRVEAVLAAHPLAQTLGGTLTRVAHPRLSTGRGLLGGHGIGSHARRCPRAGRRRRALLGARRVSMLARISGEVRSLAGNELLPVAAPSAVP